MPSPITQTGNRLSAELLTLNRRAMTMCWNSETKAFATRETLSISAMSERDFCVKCKKDTATPGT